jgi:hypothetical protein
MSKAELFDIESKKEDQRRREMAMTSNERFLLCLDLIDLSIALSKDKTLVPYQNDSIDWIELKTRNAK